MDNKKIPEISSAETDEPTVDRVLSSEIISSAMAKATSLDSFLNLLTFDCKFEEFLRKILLTLIQTVKCEAGSVLEVDHSNQTIFFRVVEGSSSEGILNFVIPLGSGIAGHVVESRVPLNVENIPENRMHLKTLAKAIGFEARNMIALPLVIRGRVYGVIELLNRLGEANFTPADVELLVYLSKMAAKAIEVRLMIATSHRTQKQENLRNRGGVE